MLLAKALATNLSLPLKQEVARDYTCFGDKYKHDKALLQIFPTLQFFSPHLGKIACDDMDFFAAALKTDPESLYNQVLGELSPSSDLAAIAPALRKAKQKIALLIALADIGKVWDLGAVTQHLSHFAAHALNTALASLLLAEESKGNLDSCQLEKCGIAVIAMGKLGAGELNYSSDIDLILLYDPAKVPYKGSHELAFYMVKLAQKLVSLMDEKTKDGYVFRTDLRIRPDPSWTPIIISTDAAKTYYESFGKYWERAALIKASALAGDTETGKDFLSHISPFIWQKSMDFRAILNLGNIRAQISQQDDSDITRSANLLGYNLKLGRGGIREIELFAQVQQLIWGGRNKDLREATTLGALAKLAKYGYISAPTKDTLTAAYTLLRTLEHRLQMQEDLQTHNLPQTAADFENFALFSGFKSPSDFTKVLTVTLKNVAAIFTDYFAAKDQSPTASLPETLAKFNLDEPTQNLITGWQNGIYRSLRSSEAKSALGQLLPPIIEALANTSNNPSTTSDSLFARLDLLFQNLPSGVQLLPLLAKKPQLLHTVLDDIIAPDNLFTMVKSNPYLLEELAAPDFFEALPSPAALAKEAQLILATGGEETALNALAIFASSKKFKAALHFLAGKITGAELGAFLSATATSTLSTALALAECPFATTYGTIKDTKAAILLLGKTATAEGNILSDLDLIFLYDCKEGSISAGGKKSLDASTYYARLVQRLISILTSHGKYGKVWEVDMRLRPSGQSGPLATSLSSFIAYQTKDAWVWEHMALLKGTKAAGNIDLSAVITQVLTSTKPDSLHLAKEICEMRQRLLSAHPTSNPWDFKNITGGMTDIEFFAAFLALTHAPQHPELLHKNTISVLRAAAKAELLTPTTATFLCDFYTEMLELKALISLYTKDWGAPFTDKLKALLCARTRAPSFSVLESTLQDKEAKAAEVTKLAYIDSPSIIKIQGHI